MRAIIAVLMTTTIEKVVLLLAMVFKFFVPLFDDVPIDPVLLCCSEHECVSVCHAVFSYGALVS